MACSGGEGSKVYGGISYIKVIIEIGGKKMSGVRVWHGSVSREISHRWGGDRLCRLSRGLVGHKQRGTLGEVDPPEFYPQKQHCGVLHLEQLVNTPNR